MAPSTIHWVRQNVCSISCPGFMCWTVILMAHLQAPVCMGKGNDTGEDFFREKHGPQIWPLRKYSPSKAREIVNGVLMV